MRRALRPTILSVVGGVIAVPLVLASALPASAAPGAPTPDSVGGLTISQVHDGLVLRDFSCTELVSAYLARIAAYDAEGPALNAIISLNPDAIDRAGEIDAAIAAGSPVGEADCLPVVVKDVINTTEMPTTYGSPAFADWTPGANASIITRLEDAGAIILAKSNLDDFAAAVYGISSLTGAMKNPYDLTRTVGGSSGGSALAIAAGYAPLAIGTDTGGSLRIPAALTGVVTIRPTIGLVSRAGMFPRALTQDTAGPLAANVKDAAIGLDLIAGVDPADPATAAGAGMIPAAGFAASAAGGRLDGIKIGLVTGGLAIWGDDPDGPVVALLTAAAAELESLGAEIVPMTAPPSNLLGPSSVITLESARDVNAFLATQGDDVPIKTFQQLYDSGSYTKYAKESYDREIAVDPTTLATNPDYANALAARTGLQDWTDEQIATNDLDAIVYPSAAQLADLIGNEQAGLFSRWSENTGFPAISVPMGYGESDGGTMLPANIEFLGGAFTEPQLIAIADAYETASALRVAPALPVIGAEETPGTTPAVQPGTAIGAGPDGTLAATGTDATPALMIGLVAVLGGALLLRLRMRRARSAR